MRHGHYTPTGGPSGRPADTLAEKTLAAQIKAAAGPAFIEMRAGQLANGEAAATPLDLNDRTARRIYSQLPGGLTAVDLHRLRRLGLDVNALLDSVRSDA